MLGSSSRSPAGARILRFLALSVLVLQTSVILSDLVVFSLAFCICLILTLAGTALGGSPFRPWVRL
ncbi:MAG TPA: hypothetical protein VLH39_01920, partial [Magnetospirillaceae bacterium]|nr:hypothetical protein [Magnetospirillaceae bacterium]